MRAQNSGASRVNQVHAGDRGMEIRKQEAEKRISKSRGHLCLQPQSYQVVQRNQLLMYRRKKWISHKFNCSKCDKIKG
jgi:hypothetical protein